MKKIFIISGLALLTALIMLILNTITPKNPIRYEEFHQLISDLENNHFTVQAEDVDKDILEGERKWLTINQTEHISVYLYENNSRMEKDASYISKDGFSYNSGKYNCCISWISVPHFYKKNNLIVLYVGENDEIIRFLNQTFKQTFAGGDL